MPNNKAEILKYLFFITMAKLVNLLVLSHQP